MEVPHELCLATTQFVKSEEIISSSPKLSGQSQTNCSKKRKLHVLHDQHDHHHHFVMSQTSVDLHLKDPLPLHWEQCLDLQSGKMYYLNRKTLRKTWNWPKEDYDHNHNDHHNYKKLDLDLELNNINSSSKVDHDNNLINFRHGRASNLNMVALPCLNCHLLVILSKSSPSCPNCKHLHTLFSPSFSPNTLSLLN